MIEGWLHDEYIVLFSESESIEAATNYKIADYLPGFVLIGLRGWDQFIAINPAGKMCSVPTVPIDPDQISSFNLQSASSLQSDGRFTGKIKWYIKPIAFGGDPKDSSNLTWVDHMQHASLVVWWNNQYRALKSQARHA